MQIFKEIVFLQKELENQRQQGKTIGFVPTMGALHEGHISLIKMAVAQTDCVVCSIFVNPVQFNNPDDLAKYPRTVDNDLELLKENGCNFVFLPSVEEIYPEPATEVYQFGELETVMEGHFRPGHFNGVAIVVKRLFDIVMPGKAFFGEKDFQQLAIVKHLLTTTKQKIEIVACPIIREKSGLAMSSRNKRLSAEELEKAPFIYKTLCKAKEKTGKETPDKIRQYVLDAFTSNKAFRLEYFELVDDKSLQPIRSFSEAEGVVGCIAAWIGEVRLIDMLRFK